MLEQFQRCFAAGAALAIAGIWTAAGAVAAALSLLAAAVAYGAVMLVQRRPQAFSLRALVALAVAPIAAAAATRPVPARPRPAPSRHVPVFQEDPEPSSSSVFGGYGW